MSHNVFQDLVKDAKTNDEYWIEDASNQFIEALLERAEQKGMSRSDLATAIGSSPAYITKIMRGNINFTLSSMVKLARAVDAKIHLQMTDQESECKWIVLYRHKPEKSNQYYTKDTIEKKRLIELKNEAANDDPIAA